MNSNPQSTQSSAIDLQLTLDLLLRNVKTLIACAVFAVVLGVAYLLVASPTLEFAARLLVQPEGRLLDEKNNRRESDSFLPTQAEVIRSPAVIGNALASISAPADELAIQDVIGRLQAQPLLGTNVMNLRLQDASEDAGLPLLDAIIKSYQTYLRETEQATNRETITLLFEREKELRMEMQKLQTEYDGIHNSGPLVGQDSILAKPRARLENIQNLLATTQSRKIKVDRYLRQLESLQTARREEIESEQIVQTSLLSSPSRSDNAAATQPKITVLATPPWAAAVEILSRMDLEGLVRLQDPLLQQALLDARSQEAQLTQRFGPRHPDVRAVQQRIRSLESQVRMAVDVAPTILTSEIEAIQREEEQLQLTYQQEFKLCKELDAAVVREQQLLDQIGSVQVIHDTVLAQLNRFEIEDGAISGGQASVSVRLLDGPQLIPAGTWPQPVPVLALSAFLGLAAGFLIVVGSQFSLRAPIL